MVSGGHIRRTVGVEEMLLHRPPKISFRDTKPYVDRDPGGIWNIHLEFKATNNYGDHYTSVRNHLLEV